MLVCSVWICLRTRAWKGRVYCARAHLYNVNTLPGIKPGIPIRLHMRILVGSAPQNLIPILSLSVLYCASISFQNRHYYLKPCASTNLPSDMAFALTSHFYILEYTITTLSDLGNVEKSNRTRIRRCKSTSLLLFCKKQWLQQLIISPLRYVFQIITNYSKQYS